MASTTETQLQHKDGCGCIWHGKNTICYNDNNCENCGECLNWKGYEEGTKKCGDCSVRQEELKELKEELETRKAMEKFFREKGIIGQNEYFDSKTREWKI